MRIPLPVVFALFAVLSGLPGHAQTGHMDPVAAELGAVRDGLDPADKAEAKLLKAVDKALASLATLVPETPLATEIKTSGKVAASIEKVLAGEGDLLTLTKAAATAYRTSIERARERISVAIALMDLPAKSRAALVKGLAAVDGGLATLTPAASASFVLKVLAKVVKYVTSAPDVPAEVEATWVLDSIGVAPANEGVDLDGDGTKDNVLGALAALLSTGGFDIDQVLATALTGSANVLLIQMWWSETDEKVLAGLVNGTDTDADLGDNFTGAESFAVSAGLDPDGHPTVRVDTVFTANGGYSVTFDTTGLTLPGLDLELPDGLPLKVQGTASAAANSGQIGFAIPVTALAAVLVGMGQPDPTATLNFFADIDLTPGTGGNDAISAALKFTAVPAGIQ